MPDTQASPSASIDAMQDVFARQRAAFEHERHRSLSERKADHEKIEKLIMPIAHRAFKQCLENNDVSQIPVLFNLRRT